MLIRKEKPMLLNERRVNIDIKKTGLKMKNIRKQRGLSVKEVTNALGLTAKQSVYKWERGDCLPHIDNFFSLCRIYEVTPAELCAFIEDENSQRFQLLCQS